MRFALVFLAGLLMTCSALGETQKPEDKKDDAAEKVLSVLDCNSFSWLKSCETLNQQIAENPGAPIRVIDKTGYEFNFPPGTPSAVIRFMMLRTPEAAKQYADYLARSYDVAEESAALYRAELRRRGGQLNRKLAISPTTNAKASAPKTINFKNVALYFIYDPNCQYCMKMLPVMRDLQKKHPNLYISMLQLKPDISVFQRVTEEFGLKALVLEGQKLEEIRGRIRATPTIWVMDKRTKRTSALEGVQSIEAIESELAETSK